MLSDVHETHTQKSSLIFNTALNSLKIEDGYNNVYTSSHAQHGCCRQEKEYQIALLYLYCYKSCLRLLLKVWIRKLTEPSGILK